MTTPVTYRRGTDGREVAIVPLTNHREPAILDADDYRRVAASLGPRAWFVNDNGKGRFYVRAHTPSRDNLVMIARLIMGEPIGRCVKHRDGDPLNLCRSNLEPAKPRKTRSRSRQAATSAQLSVFP